MEWPLSRAGRAAILLLLIAGNWEPTQGRRLLRSSHTAELTEDPSVTAQLDQLLPAVAARSSYEGEVVIATTSNIWYTDLTLNLFSSMKRLGRDRLVVFCADPLCYRNLSARAPEGMHVVHLPGHNDTKNDTFDSPAFNRLTGGKLTYIRWFLEHNFTVLFTDSDIVWLRDPLPDLLRFPNASLVVQDDTPEEWAPTDMAVLLRHYPCTGFFLMRPTVLGKNLTTSWDKALSQDYERNQDQIQAVNIFRRSCRQWCGDELHDCDSSADCRLLPRSHYPNGRTAMHWEKNWTSQRLGSQQPYIVHANWVEGYSSKVRMLKGFGYWYLPPS